MTTTECWNCSAVALGDAIFCTVCLRDGYPTRLSFGRYRVEEELGRGAFGIVYKCVDPVMGRRVAIKQLERRAFSILDEVEELRVPGRLEHPNIVSIYDVIESDGAIVMEFAEGGSLRDRLRSDPAWVRTQFVPLVLDICAGLQAAHAEGIIHRDLKPDNILLTASGRAKIADFGVAKFLESTEYTDSVAGSPPYMAIEVLEGRPYGVEADIHSLGCMMFELLAGRWPWIANGRVMAFLAAKSAAPAPSLRAFDASIDDVTAQLVARMLADDGSRVRNADVVVQQLRYVDPSAGLVTIDDLQLRVGAIYGYVNANRSPIYLLSQFLISLRRLSDAMRGGTSEQIERLFPKSFAWLCAVATAMNVRLGQLIWLKYDGLCPYCQSPECSCAEAGITTSVERNAGLLARLHRRQVNQAPVASSVSEYRAMFERIYGVVNGNVGLDATVLHSYSEVAEALDAVLHLSPEDGNDSLLALHLELSDLLAWLFALMNIYSIDFDFERAFSGLFGEGCYACGTAPCTCAEPLGVSNWRRALGVEPAYEAK
ncbi:protein kinase domain-containing protein [Microbacterium aurum]